MSSPNDGFSLVEVMVALAIIGLLAMMIPAVPFGRTDSVAATAVARTLASDLRRLRSEAVTRNAETVWRPGADMNLASLPAAAKPRFAADFGGIDPAAFEIRFFGDGSSSGGRIELEIGDFARSIVVDGITGTVRVQERGR